LFLVSYYKNNESASKGFAQIRIRLTLIIFRFCIIILNHLYKAYELKMSNLHLFDF